jgi:predicted nucleotidyltransferase component of viral defense system
MLRRYDLENINDFHNALREILQEIALAGLYRGGFFKKTAFYGGTCLRIFYGLDRFSEDLDFSLLVPDEGFCLDPYFQAIEAEFESLGVAVEITQKKRSSQSAIESAFLKSSTDIHILSLAARTKLKTGTVKQQIKIKFEVDTNPPPGFATEERLLLQPYSFYVKCYVVEDLYAGKMHALLFRRWKQRVKGRDWYDFEWYVKNGFSLNLDHFNIRAIESGHIEKESKLTKDGLLDFLENKIATLNIESVKIDIRRFIKDKNTLDIWSRDYFLELSRMMKINNSA